MTRSVLWSVKARRRRRVGVVLGGIAVVLVVAGAINVWLAVGTGVWWPYVVMAAELAAAVVVGGQARRYFRRARQAAVEAGEAALVGEAGAGGGL